MTIYEYAAMDVISEVNRAKEKYPFDFSSTHEGYAVIKEEVDEMWDEIKRNNTELAVKEAIQVAAMAIRFVAEFSEPSK